MIIWLRQKLWLFGSGTNYDYLAQAQIMKIWLKPKLWKCGCGSKSAKEKNFKAFSTIQTATQVLHGSVVPAVHVFSAKSLDFFWKKNFLKKDNKITYGQVYCQNKKEVQQNQTVRLFMLSSGFSGDFMATSMFWCVASAVYQVFFCSGPGFYFGSARPSASPHQNKTLAPHKKNLINCFGNTSEHLTVHKIPRKAW